MSTEIDLEIWVIRALDRPYTIEIHQGMRNFQPDHYLNTGKFRVESISAHIVCDSYKAFIDFFQHGKFDGDDQYNQAIPLGEKADAYIHASDKKPFYDEVNMNMSRYGIPLSRLDHNSKTDYNMRTGND